MNRERESLNSIRDAAAQKQFLSVVSRDEATRRFRDALSLTTPEVERVPLAAALGRVVAHHIKATLDIPGFDRSNVDGFAVRSVDTSGAMEESPRQLRLNAESILPGIVPQLTVAPGTATPIATGGMIPRGADAVLMIEHSELIEEDDSLTLEVTRSVQPSAFITFAGSDIALGETVLWKGQVLSSREIGVLAALGLAEVDVYRRPQVAIISTGDEIVAPGRPLSLGSVFDSNAAILSAAVTELGCEPVVLGAVHDNEHALKEVIDDALKCDFVLLSGGTSKGAGDISYQTVREWTDPGIVAHGVALKPGKPICLAVTNNTPVVILPGFPTSAIFTFHEFVAPVLRLMAGLPETPKHKTQARVPMRINSDKGRTEYSLVRLFGENDDLRAYPLGKGSGAVTTFSHADGFIAIPTHQEIIEENELVEVTLLDARLKAPDLVVVGSHCVGLDYLLSLLREQGFSVTTMHVGSQGGVSAVRRNECDLAGIHLFDEQSGTYNQPFVPESSELIPGYARTQYFVFRPDDSRFTNLDADSAIRAATSDPSCVLVNRNRGSGTRILLDQRLTNCIDDATQLPGYGVQVKSHNAVAAAIKQGRADWGIAIETVAREYGLASLPLQPEQYDFLIPKSRMNRPAVAAFRKLLDEFSIKTRLEELGFQLP
ncbi:MAG: molybdopterin biosynthesis protein [Planctomycetaceae bacterium]|nr:molybdopterin biosynthesis protein [Planctomycetaceae bacterium]